MKHITARNLYFTVELLAICCSEYYPQSIDKFKASKSSFELLILFFSERILGFYFKLKRSVVVIY